MQVERLPSGGVNFRPCQDHSDLTFVICIFHNRKLATDGFSMEQSWRVWLTTPFSLRRYPGIIGVAFLIVVAFLVVVVVGVVVIVDDQT